MNLPSMPPEAAPVPWEFNALDTVKYFRDLQELEAKVEPRRNRGGRPSYWDWARAVIAVSQPIIWNGMPEDGSTGIARLLRAWFDRNGPEGGPDDRDIRNWAQEIYSAWKSPE